MKRLVLALIITSCATEMAQPSQSPFVCPEPDPEVECKDYCNDKNLSLVRSLAQCRSELDLLKTKVKTRRHK